jgi:glycosyl-4,4'-diaponeurosporenoate acyltransferase
MSSAAIVVLLDATVWVTWSVIVGLVAHLVPRHLFERDSWITRSRPWERGGRAYEQVRIRQWKDHVPEVGAKRALRGRSRSSLECFILETRRAEYVHLAIAAITPVFALWTPPLLMVAMVTYAVAANVPCIAIQRYNRARLYRLPSTSRDVTRNVVSR